MGLENVNRCQHVKVNGTQCGSPALRRRRHCFFHKRVLDQVARIAAAERFGQARFVVPLLEDANAVQLALMQVMQLLGSGQMDHKTAGLMLYALQTASVNLRNTEFEAEEVTEVVIDRDTVDRTSMGGPQWFAEDFEDDEVDGAEEAEEVAEEVEAEVRTDRAVKVEHVSLEEARKQVQGLARNWVMKTVEAAVGREPG